MRTASRPSLRTRFTDSPPLFAATLRAARHLPFKLELERRRRLSRYLTMRYCLYASGLLHLKHHVSVISKDICVSKVMFGSARWALWRTRYVYTFYSQASFLMSTPPSDILSKSSNLLSQEYVFWTIRRHCEARMFTLECPAPASEQDVKL